MVGFILCGQFGIIDTLLTATTTKANTPPHVHHHSERHPEHGMHTL